MISSNNTRASISQVRLEKHTLYIYDEKDSADSVVVKIKLSNCVVKDWSDERWPFVMEIRRVLGRSHYLQAESETGRDVLTNFIHQFVMEYRIFRCIMEN